MRPNTLKYVRFKLARGGGGETRWEISQFRFILRPTYTKKQQPKTRRVFLPEIWVTAILTATATKWSLLPPNQVLLSDLNHIWEYNHIHINTTSYDKSWTEKTVQGNSQPQTCSWLFRYKRYLFQFRVLLCDLQHEQQQLAEVSHT